MGEAEPESPQAGGLIDADGFQPEGDCARDVPELALGLLAGSLMLCGPAVPPSVRDWLSQTLGPGFQPASFPATIPGVEVASIRQSEMPGRAAAVLDACPSWLDSSPLTFELAEEIWLREGRHAADPERDARGLPVSVRTPAHPVPRIVPAHALVDGVALEVARR